MTNSKLDSNAEPKRTSICGPSEARSSLKKCPPKDAEQHPSALTSRGRGSYAAILWGPNRQTSNRLGIVRGLELVLNRG
jgi:hypothetical protein